ncbi:DUF1629 domain-containing protein [Lysobacter sp. CA199]|uniref:DUF1629 domain-containing protein n=1 Tax=Lysobacter sp. CA199 TaxID=3455608 RepID=UPI003F8CFF2B
MNRPEIEPVGASSDVDGEAGKFYVLDADYRGAGPFHGVVFANLDRLLTGRAILLPAERGFPELREKPLLVHDPEKGGMPRDLESGLSGYWLVSERLKNLFEKIDPDGFAFAACDFRLADGTEGPTHYLCDVVRSLDALDEDRSRVKILVDDDFVNGKAYDLGGGARLVFREDMVAGAHVFHSPFADYEFCDELLRDLLIAGRFTGVGLVDATRY